MQYFESRAIGTNYILVKSTAAYKISVCEFTGILPDFVDINYKFWHSDKNMFLRCVGASEESTPCSAELHWYRRAWEPAFKKKKPKPQNIKGFLFRAGNHYCNMSHQKKLASLDSLCSVCLGAWSCSFCSDSPVPMLMMWKSVNGKIREHFQVYISSFECGSAASGLV